MTGVTEPSGSPFSDQSFVYDAAYNRSNWTLGSTSTSYTANNLDEYTAIGSATPGWNSDGGLHTFAGSTYSYDALMRLTEVDYSGGKTVFGYDPLGRRVQKVDLNSSGTVLATYQYHYDGSDVAVEYRPSSETWTYCGTLLREDGSGAKQWYYRDGHDSVSAVADNSGDVLEAYEYTPQGTFQITNGSGTVETATGIGNDILYVSMRYDAETSNYYDNARYYSAVLGRFISRDPLSNAEFSQGTNLYAYCENDYLNRLDPSGNSWLGVVTGILDTAGCIPIVQDFTDPVSALVCLAQGDKVGAGLAIAGVIPGAGEAADIAKAARDVKALVHDTEGAAKEAENAIKCTEGACFEIGTLISTPGGEKPIEQISAGDEVYAYDFGQDKVVASHVLAIYRNTTTEWDDLTFQDGETVHATPTHPFWIESMYAWVGASQLTPGMEVQLENGQEEAVLSNVLRPLSKPETTYNFQVENEHDYFVGTGQILVHNACKATGGANKVDQIAKDIEESGATVKQNAKTASQEGNVTVDFGKAGRMNLRVETHPLAPGGPPVRHANVEKVTQSGNQKTVTNTHITQ